MSVKLAVSMMMQPVQIWWAVSTARVMLDSLEMKSVVLVRLIIMGVVRIKNINFHY